MNKNELRQFVLLAQIQIPIDIKVCPEGAAKGSKNEPHRRPGTRWQKGAKPFTIRTGKKGIG